MIEIGVQTKGIIPDKSPDEAIHFIKEAGFTKLDYNLDVFLKIADLKKNHTESFFSNDIEALRIYFQQYVEAMEKYGVRASQMHAPYPVRIEEQEQVNEYVQGLVIPKSIIIAEVLGVPYVVVHPFKMQCFYSRERERQENIEYFKMLVPLLKQCKVKICFENLYGGVGGRFIEGVCADPEDAIWYVDTMNEYAGEELFGFCLDTGHLQIAKRDPYEFITKLGSRLKIFHIHENDGVFDLHQMPFTFGAEKGYGLDWEGVIRGLKEINYQGTLSFETFPCMKSYPKAMASDVLRTIYKIGEYLAEEIEK